MICIKSIIFYDIITVQRYNKIFLQCILEYRIASPGNYLRICYGCNHLLEFATLIETSVPECLRGCKQKSQPLSQPLFQNLSGLRSGLQIITLNRNLKVLKFATLRFFLWLQSGLRLQFCNPETLWNGGYNKVAIRVAISIRNPETVVTTRLRPGLRITT